MPQRRTLRMCCGGLSGVGTISIDAIEHLLIGGRYMIIQVTLHVWLGKADEAKKETHFSVCGGGWAGASTLGQGSPENRARSWHAYLHLARWQSRG